MTKSKTLALVAVTTAIVGASALGVAVTHADTTTTTAPQSRLSSIVAAIAQKFNLNSADVQSVVDSTVKTDMAARETKMQQNFDTQLSKAVTAGKITQAQADLIKSKAAEVKASIDADRNANPALTKAEMKAKMDQRITDLKAWATTNNIPQQFLRFVGIEGGRGMKMGLGFGFGHGGSKPAQTTTTQ